MTTTFSHFVRGLSSYNANVLMAALISLLLVILFILLLHIYAKWFLAHPRTTRRSRAAVRNNHRFINHSRSFPLGSSELGTKGLDPAAISSIPLFLYKLQQSSTVDVDDDDEYYYCVICLSQFEENEGGRRLSKCGHCFHVDCLDMWLHSHSNCPICRAPAVMTTFSSPAHHQTNSTPPAEGDATLLVLQVHEIHHHSSSDDHVDDTTMSASSSSSPSSCIGYCSLKRMLSRNRSEGKIFPNSNYEEDGQLQILQL